MYDGLIRATLDALRNLNLSYHLATTPDPDQQPPSATAKLDAWSADEQEALAAELGSGLVAGNPHDMNAFIQLSGECCIISCDLSVTKQQYADTTTSAMIHNTAAQM